MAQPENIKPVSDEVPQQRSLLFKTLGFAFLGIGGLGVVLPLLPTTPFLLLAAACFARSSARWHAWLLGNPTFGPMIRDWEAHRCIPRRAKIASLAIMGLVGGSSLVFAVTSPAARGIGLALLTVGVVVVLRIPVCRQREIR